MWGMIANCSERRPTDAHFHVLDQWRQLATKYRIYAAGRGAASTRICGVPDPSHTVDDLKSDVCLRKVEYPCVQDHTLEGTPDERRSFNLQKLETDVCISVLCSLSWEVWHAEDPQRPQLVKFFGRADHQGDRGHAVDE